MASIALHALLLAPVIRDAVSSRVRPPDRSQGNETEAQWIVLEALPERSSATNPDAGMATPELAPIGLSAASSPPVVPADANDDAERPGQSPHSPAVSALSARYAGQIQARIERAWRRPRNPIDAAIFRCRVRIDQDRSGRVTEIALVRCNGGTRWQLSLVQAIQAASPLPAPPVAAVFARKMLLEFRAAAYSPGAPAELYEPPQTARSTRDENAELPRDVLNALRGTPSAAGAGRVVQLRIEGSKVAVDSNPGRNTTLPH